jgi:hypothetical protein
MGDPDTIPAGRYGRQAREHWRLGHVSGRIIGGQCAHSAEFRIWEAPGIVYATDAAGTARESEAWFPAATHTAITYPAGLCCVRNAG